MSKNRLDEILKREIHGAKQTPSVKDAVAMLMGNDKHSIPKPAQKSTAKKRAKRNAADGSKEVEQIDQIQEIDHIAEIPDGFPKGTILNDDGTLTLPDGRMIRKKQEVSDG